MKFPHFLLLVFIPFAAFSQQKKSDCGCPISKFAETKADTVFHLSRKKSIVLCGYNVKDIIKGKKLFSEFVLSVCGSDTIIKFWGAVLVCDVKTSGDTLLVQTIYELPVGKSMQYQQTVWTTEHIYFKNDKLFRDSVINSGLRKYTPQQISGVLDLYNRLPNENNDSTSDLADKLLVSTMSGSKKARACLVNFGKKFSALDGVYLEDYDTKIRMLNAWEKQNDGGHKP